MNIKNNQIIDKLIANLLIFSHTFSKDLEHCCGINFMSSGLHCKAIHDSTELK